MKKLITGSFACVKCRKAFKKARFNQLRDGSWVPIQYSVVCPQCHGGVYEAGAAFKAPRQSDSKAWLALEPLFSQGYKFNPSFGAPPLNARLEKQQPSEFRKPARKRRGA
jgi:hypothetical protein